MLFTSRYQSIIDRFLLLLILFSICGNANAQGTNVLVVDVDSVLAHSYLADIKTRWLDAWYQPAMERLASEKQEFQEEIIRVQRYYSNCCSCRGDYLEQGRARLLTIADSLNQQEQGLQMLDSLLSLRFKEFTFETCAHLAEQYSDVQGGDILIIDASKIGRFSVVSEYNLTAYMINGVNSSLLFPMRLAMLQSTLHNEVQTFLYGDLEADDDSG